MKISTFLTAIVAGTVVLTGCVGKDDGTNHEGNPPGSDSLSSDMQSGTGAGTTAADKATQPDPASPASGRSREAGSATDDSALPADAGSTDSSGSSSPPQ
jgi:hypothetical protein